jgi:hypothetical protein
MARGLFKSRKSKKKSSTPTEQKDTSTSTPPRIGAHRSAPPLPSPAKPVPLPVIGAHRAKSPPSKAPAPIAEMQKWQASRPTGGSEQRAPMIGRGRGLGVSRGDSAPTPTPTPQVDDELAPYTANYNYNNVDALRFEPEDDKDTGGYNNAGYGNARGAYNTGMIFQVDDDKDDQIDVGPYNNAGYGESTYTRTSDDRPRGAYNTGMIFQVDDDKDDQIDVGPYNNAGYGESTYTRTSDDRPRGAYNTGMIFEVDDDKDDGGSYNNTEGAYSVTSFDPSLANLVKDEVKNTVDAQKSDAPGAQGKAGKGGPAKEVPAVRKHRAWLVSQLQKGYAEERTTQRADLTKAIGELGEEIAKYYIALREMQKLDLGDHRGMTAILKVFDEKHAIHQAYDVETALEQLEYFHAITLEKARRQELPITEDGQVGDLTGRLVEYDDTAAQERSLVLVGGQKLHRNDEKKTPVDTKAGVTHFTGVGAEIFVVGMNNEIHMASHKIGKFHHSSLLGGQPVSMAGEIKATAGKIDWISNKSGHYRPSEIQLMQFLHHLGKDVALDFPVKGMGVPDNVTARQLVDGVNGSGKAKKKLGHNAKKTEELLLAWIALLGKDEVSDVMELNDWVLEEIDDDEYEVVDVNDKKVAPEKVRRALKKAHPDKNVVVGA